MLPQLLLHKTFIHVILVKLFCEKRFDVRAEKFFE